VITTRRIVVWLFVAFVTFGVLNVQRSTLNADVLSGLKLTSADLSYETSDVGDTLMDVPSLVPTMYLQPANINYGYNNATLGTRFNVTAWVANASVSLGGAQAHVEFNDTIINATRWFMPTWDPSFFMPQTPSPPSGLPSPPNTGYQHLSQSLGSVEVAVTKGGLPPSSPWGHNGTIAIIEFNITRLPSAGEQFSSVLCLNNTGTYLLDTTGATIPGTIIRDGSYTIDFGTVRTLPPHLQTSIPFLNVSGDRITFPESVSTTPLVMSGVLMSTENDMISGYIQVKANTWVSGSFIDFFIGVGADENFIAVGIRMDNSSGYYLYADAKVNSAYNILYFRKWQGAPVLFGLERVTDYKYNIWIDGTLQMVYTTPVAIPRHYQAVSEASDFGDTLNALFWGLQYRTAGTFHNWGDVYPRQCSVVEGYGDPEHRTIKFRMYGWTYSSFETYTSINDLCAPFWRFRFYIM
jgi:hypothetical protein